MDTTRIPATWNSIETPTILYWRGLDILEREWERTQLLGSKPDDIYALHEYLFWRQNAVVWACCAIESFVNEEGVAWLGERFYKKNVERLRVLQKVEVLYALKYRRRLDPGAETLARISDLFDLRNRFVHPKTHEVADRKARSDDTRERLEKMTPADLRKALRSVTSLFEPIGVGEGGDQEKTAEGCPQNTTGEPGETSPHDTPPKMGTVTITRITKQR